MTYEVFPSTLEFKADEIEMALRNCEFKAHCASDRRNYLQIGEKFLPFRF